MLSQQCLFTYLHILKASVIFLQTWLVCSTLQDLRLKLKLEMKSKLKFIEDVSAGPTKMPMPEQDPNAAPKKVESDPDPVTKHEDADFKQTSSPLLR